MSVIDAIIAKKLCGGGGGGNVPKPLTYDYMPEGYPTKAMGTVTLIAEQAVEFASIGNGIYSALLEGPLKIVEGQTYTVNWDGTEYECVCVIAQSAPVIGNLSIMGAGNDTGEPFLCSYNNREASTEFYTLDTSASHTISVKTTEEIATPMAGEFLPAGVGTTAVITRVTSTNKYSSGLTYDELHEILSDHRQVVLWEPEHNRCSYITKWKKKVDGSISLAFAGDSYSVSLHTDGTFGAITG